MGTPNPRIEQARELHHRHWVVDAHCDTVSPFPHREDFVLDLGGMANTHVDLPRLREAGVNVQVFAAFVRPGQGPGEGHFQKTRVLLERLREQALVQSESMAIAENAGDIQRVAGDGSFHQGVDGPGLPRTGARVAAVLAVEGGDALEGRLDRLQDLYALGVRILGLTWNSHTGWADGCRNDLPIPPVGGLSSFGRDVVREMERLGILVDLAHASARTVDATLETGTQPVVNTHTAAASLREHPRNLSDEHLRGIAATGGVVGICFVPKFLTGGDTGDVRIVADHVEHVIAVAGEDHVGLGSDFDGVRDTVFGLENTAMLPHLTAELLIRGYPEATLLKFLGTNWLRVFSRACGL